MKTIMRPIPLLTYVFFANFIVFGIICTYLGGDALTGKVVDGHFFLGNHGRFTEVSKSIFEYSAWHARSVFGTALLAIINSLLSRYRNRKHD